MVSIPRRLIAPCSAVFGTPDRMLAMHDRAGLAGFASSTINAVIPWMARDSVNGYHAVDVLVIGSNPVLAAAAIHRATKRDLSVAAVLSGVHDEWPYDLAASSRGVPLVEGVFGCEGRGSGNPGWRMAQVIRDLLEDADGISLLPEGTSVAMSGRQPSGEALVHAWQGKTEAPSDPVQKRLVSEFRSAVARHPSLSVSSGRRKTAIFAKSVVLVSMVDGFAKADGTADASRSIAWPHDRIVSFGSAAWTPGHATEAAARMVDDLVSVSKLDLSIFQ